MNKIYTRTIQLPKPVKVRGKTFGCVRCYKCSKLMYNLSELAIQSLRVRKITYNHNMFVVAYKNPNGGKIPKQSGRN